MSALLAPTAPAKFTPSTLVLVELDYRQYVGTVIYSYSTPGNAELTYVVQVEGCNYPLNESELKAATPGKCEWSSFNEFCGPVVGVMFDDRGVRYTTCQDHHNEEYARTGRELL